MSQIDVIRNTLKSAVTLTQKEATRFFKTEPGSYAAHDVFIGVTVPNLRKFAQTFSALSLKWSDWQPEQDIATVHVSDGTLNKVKFPSVLVVADKPVLRTVTVAEGSAMPELSSMTLPLMVTSSPTVAVVDVEPGCGDSVGLAGSVAA